MIPISDLLHNQFLQGAGLLGVGGSLFVSLKSLPLKMINKIKSICYRRIAIVELTDTSIFRELLQYVSDNSKKRKFMAIDSCLQRDGRIKIKLLSRDSNHRFWFLKRPLNLRIIFLGDEIAAEKKDANAIAQKHKPVIIELSSYFLSVKNLYKFLNTKILPQINERLLEKKSIDLLFYRTSNQYWTSTAETTRRSLDSLVYNDEALANKILEDAKKFLEDRHWYESMSIPHRRGYLLYGEPGNGKTSLIKAIASELNFNIAVVNLTSMSDDSLQHALRTLPENSILLFEDIDSMFQNMTAVNQRPDKSSTTASEQLSSNLFSQLTFSGLLNALDGVMSSSNRIIFMTTNHIQHLDAALIRPGRCDMRIYIGNPTIATISRMYDRFFPTDSASNLESFLETVQDRPYCMAEIQEKLLAMRNESVAVNIESTTEQANVY